ncbi:MAG: hypothetical protein R3B13_40580 [Polyangiaceae bacterium]
MTRPEDPRRLGQVEDDPMLARALGVARRELPGDERMTALAAALATKLTPAGCGTGGSGASGSGDAGAQLGGNAAAEGAKITATEGVKAAASSALGTKAIVAGVVVAALGAAIVVARSPTPTPHEQGTALTPASSTTMPLSPPTVTAAPSADAPRTDGIPTVSLNELPKLPPPPSAKPQSTTEPKADRAAEMALLRKAQDAVASNPSAALGYVSEHRQSFPRSVFSQERDVLEITALVRLGRRAEAEAKADAFARAFPKSGHLRRIDSVLGR